MLRFRFSNVLFDRIRYLGFPEKQIVSRNMLNNLNANRQSKRTVKHDKLYPMQNTVKITNITIPSKIKLRLDQIFEITYLDKSVNNMQIRNKEVSYGVDTNTYHVGETTSHNYLISYINLSLTAKIDVNNAAIVCIGGGGGGGEDNSSDYSPGGGGGGGYALVYLNIKAGDRLELHIGEGGLAGGIYDPSISRGGKGGTTYIERFPSNSSDRINHIETSGGEGGNNTEGGYGGDLCQIVGYTDVISWVFYNGGRGGDRNPGYDSTVVYSYGISVSTNEVPYPSDVEQALNAVFAQATPSDVTSYGGGGGGSTGNNDDSFTNGLGATNGTGGARGISDSDAYKGPGTAGFNGGGGGAGAVRQNGGNGGKGLVIMYVETQYGDQYYM